HVVVEWPLARELESRGPVQQRRSLGTHVVIQRLQLRGTRRGQRQPLGRGEVRVYRDNADLIRLLRDPLHRNAQAAPLRGGADVQWQILAQWLEVILALAGRLAVLHLDQLPVLEDIVGIVVADGARRAQRDQWVILTVLRQGVPLGRRRGGELRPLLEGT